MSPLHQSFPQKNQQELGGASFIRNVILMRFGGEDAQARGPGTDLSGHCLSLSQGEGVTGHPCVTSEPSSGNNTPGSSARPIPLSISMDCNAGAIPSKC